MGEPEILLDGEHDIDRTFEVASQTWAETFKFLEDQDVLLDRILLKPSMVGPGADCPKRNAADAQFARAAGRAWNHVPVGRTLGARLDALPQRDEPVAQPVARVVLVRARAAEHGAQDVVRRRRQGG